MEQPMEPQPVKFVRLNTGEDIICELGEPTKPDTVLIKRPLKVFYSMMENNSGMSSMGVSLIHWIFPKICKNEEYEIDSKDVLLVSDASQDISEYYTEAISTIKLNDVYKEYLDDEYLEDGDMEIDLSEEDEEAVNEFLESIKSNQKRTLH